MGKGNISTAQNLIVRIRYVFYSREAFYCLTLSSLFRRRLILRKSMKGGDGVALRDGQRETTARMIETKIITLVKKNYVFMQTKRLSLLPKSLILVSLSPVRTRNSSKACNCVLMFPATTCLFLGSPSFPQYRVPRSHP